jgi:hypothetical protein
MNARILKIPATVRLLPILLLLVLPAAVQAQFTYTTANNQITISKYTGLVNAVSVPSTINNLPVIRIGPAAFQFNNIVTSVIIPNSVTSIGTNAFEGCSYLATVVIGNGVTSIEDSAFDLCTSLTSVTIGNSVTSIGYRAFISCSSLTSVTFPASLTSFGDQVFVGCSVLTNVYFLGNAPSGGGNNVFTFDPATVYYLPGTTGWGVKYGGVQTWNPQVRTRDGSFGVLTNQFGFNITGNNNLVVVVEACTDIVNPIWFPVATNTLTGGSTFFSVPGSSYFSDPQWTNYPKRFYRLRSP